MEVSKNSSRENHLFLWLPVRYVSHNQRLGAPWAPSIVMGHIKNITTVPQQLDQ